MPILFLIFVIIPVFEIYLLIKIGGLIGVWETIGVILLTAFIGSFLVRQQGLSLLFSAQSKLEKDQVPATELFEGLCLLIAGLLLITPGFFTDTIGFLLLVPPLRKLIWYKGLQAGLQHMSFTFTNMRQGRPGGGPSGDDIIDADYEEIKDENKQIKK